MFSSKKLYASQLYTCLLYTSYLTLSGGEKQLCILARTIAEDAPLLLLDEPASALDLANRSRMTALLAQLVHTGGKTALVCLCLLYTSPRWRSWA